MNYYDIKIFFAILLGMAATTARADAIAAFDENSSRTGTASYGLPGAITATSDSLIFDVVPHPDFGTIAGTVYTAIFPQVDFAPSAYQWEWRFRLLAGNNVPHMAAVYSDNDTASFSQESWIFDFDISGITPADGWVTLRQGFGAPFLVSGVGDGVQNPDLGAIAILGANVNTNRFHMEMDYLRIVSVPEPGSWMLVGLGIASCAGRRFRARAAVAKAR